jgi:hypothetical protein
MPSRTTAAHGPHAVARHLFPSRTMDREAWPARIAGQAASHRGSAATSRSPRPSAEAHPAGDARGHARGSAHMRRVDTSTGIARASGTAPDRRHVGCTRCSQRVAGTRFAVAMNVEVTSCGAANPLGGTITRSLSCCGLPTLLVSYWIAHGGRDVVSGGGPEQRARRDVLPRNWTWRGNRRICVSV